MQLANDRGDPDRASPSHGNPANPSRFRTTLSRATGALRKNSNAPKPDEHCTQAPTRRTPINIAMVSAPRPESFVHAAHASDADEAEAILQRWGQDGVGKVGNPSWVQAIKKALKAQAQRTQAETIAQIQAALHDSQDKPLHVVNGLPSIVSSTTTTATAGHGAYDAQSAALASPATPATHATPAAPAGLPRSPGVLNIPSLTAETGHRDTQQDYFGVHADHSYDTLRRDDNPAIKISSVHEVPQNGGNGLSHGSVITTNAEDGQPDGNSDVVEPCADDICPSLTTIEKSVAAKIYFENLYFGILKRPVARDTRRAGLERELGAMKLSDERKEAIRQAWIARETEHLRQVRARVSANSFAKLKTIGHGAFGVVALVKERQSGQLYAMKQLRKADMLRKGQEGHVRAERDLMTSASASGSRRWIVNLIYSFQDLDHLYLIMEFMGGGDLLNLLIEKDVFAEDFAKFYVAEMILCIHEAHRLGYIHRDIKPDNFLFTADGHIKLADFGLCQSFHWAHDGAYYDQQRRNLLHKHGIDLEDTARHRNGIEIDTVKAMKAGATQNAPQLSDKALHQLMSDRNADGSPCTHVFTWREKNRRKVAYSVVGTNNYMAPEVLRGLGYDQSCDWWSLGVIVFEMLYGYPPFVSKSRHLTRQKILNWRQTLKFPPGRFKVSREAQDFISRLLCEKEDRLGSMSSSSVSRPNSLMQGARNSGFTQSRMETSAASSSSLIDGVEELMAHPWLRSIRWSDIHKQRAPFRPDLSHPADTKHFEEDIADEPLAAPGRPTVGPDGRPLPEDPARDPMLRDELHGERLLEMRKQLAFLNYTFKAPPGFDVKQIQEHERGAASKQLDTATQSSRIRAMSM